MHNIIVKAMSLFFHTHIIGDSYFDRVDEATSQCEIFTVTADCRVVDFMSKSVSMIYNPVKGQGYYEFIEPEYISPNKQVILVDQVSVT